MTNNFEALDVYPTLSDEELVEVNGGIGGWLGDALNGLANGLNMWNHGGFPTYNIGGNSGYTGYNPNNYWY